MAPPRSSVSRTELVAAPTAFISYAHGGDDTWDATVLDFATALRRIGGIDADLDQWHVIGGQNWTTYGPSAIRDSNFTLIAVSPAYKAAWEGTNEPARNPGAAREAAEIKSIFERDQREFRRRVKVVLLRGAGEEHIPGELLASLERFPVPTPELADLEPLLRSLLGKPPHVKPALGRLPALPPRTIAVLTLESQREGARPEAGGAASPDAGDDSREIADVLSDRLAVIDASIATDPAESAPVERMEERSAVKASLDAVERALPPGVARQRMVSDYLKAQLYMSAGAYRAAERRLTSIAERLSDVGPPDCVLEPCLRELTAAMLDHNAHMRSSRHAATLGHRHPQPPVLKLDRERLSGVRAFYEVARCALHETGGHGQLDVIRKGILRGRVPAETHAARLYGRYTEQQRVAAFALELAPPSPRGDPGANHLLARAGLHGAEDSVAADVLATLATAHLAVHLVERRRSGPVGAILARDNADLEADELELRRAIALNTFAIAITETMPWMFAASEDERRKIQFDPVAARRDLWPAPAMWPSRQVTLMALYRRSHGFRLLGDHERAYHDLRMLQRVGRLTREARKADDEVWAWVGTLEALAEYRIGELYRTDHDYMQALVHLCRSHDSVRALREREGSTIAGELGHLEIKLSLGKGKAFFEIGALKRSLKWHLNAWRWLLALESPDPALEQRIDGVEAWLDSLKNDPVLYKDALQEKLHPLLLEMCERDLEAGHRALEAEILVRISHLLTVVRLPEDDHPHALEAESSALRCMLRAAELDDRNLLVQSGLLRYAMRWKDANPGVELPERLKNLTMPDALDCWPSGASEVDQVIRAAEHLMLERLYAAGGTTGKRRQGVAQALLAHFTTHTDSINLRGAILHRYLMRPRVEDREPLYDGPAPGNGDRALTSSTSRAPYLEFVCLRRFGSFTPFMPRPAAVSAVGGGYLARVVHAPQPGQNTRPRMFNILVDPGEGAVNNLYAMGLSIADIDMVVGTHDHPEHLAALDAILTLRRELRRRAAASNAIGNGSSSHAPRLLILGNRSVVNRYSFLNGDRQHLVAHIADSPMLEGKAIPRGVTFTELHTRHQDLGGHHASGFVLGLESDGGNERLTIAFMADTAIEALHVDEDPKRELEADWAAALASDVVIAHVSDIPTSEVRGLAGLARDHDDDAIRRFDRLVRTLAAERPDDASQLMRALSLAPSQSSDDPPKVSLMSSDAIDPGDQLYLTGLLEVCEHMCEVDPPPGGGARVLIVGELREQLGSFRGTVAREINRRMVSRRSEGDAASVPLVALTADIGLRIRLITGGEDVHRRLVLCSTCSYNNDRLDLERFHPPHEMCEVCVKGDHEAMYWNCDLHDPGQRKRAMFIEQMGGYDPFAAGGRYHG